MSFGRLAEKKTRHESAGSEVNVERGEKMFSGAEVEGRDAWIVDDRCPAGANWLTAVYGRCCWLGGAKGAEPPVVEWRCEGARLTSLLRVGGRELGFEENGENAPAVYGRDLDEELVLEDCVEEAGYEEVDEDEEKDSDNRLSQRRDVDGREAWLGGNKPGDCCCDPFSLVGVVQLEGLLGGNAPTTGSVITGETEILGGIAAFVSWLLKSFAAQGRARANPQAAIPTVEVAQSCIVENKLCGQNKYTNTWITRSPER